MDKKQLRRTIAQNKKNYSQEQLKVWSSSLLHKLEDHPAFVAAQTVLLYYSLPDEVQTHDFIERWKDTKQIILPVVIGPTELELRHYTGKSCLTTGAFQIEEPSGEAFIDFHAIDLAIIPGVGFDSLGNRLGRGKGFYDRLLPKINAPKIGICFQFQVVDNIPTGPYDYPMNEIHTENGKIYPDIKK